LLFNALIKKHIYDHKKKKKNRILKLDLHLSSWVCHLVTTWPWASHLTLLNLGYLTCRMCIKLKSYIWLEKNLLDSSLYRAWHIVSVQQRLAIVIKFFCIILMANILFFSWDSACKTETQVWEDHNHATHHLQRRRAIVPSACPG
jgi:hypothetical protein